MTSEFTVSPEITRDFVTVSGRWGTRQVHYRRAGSGPLVLMLHQSPQSSRELESLMNQWAPHFTLIAPDTPGYGQSDPLGLEQAQLSDFAAATLEFLDALGAKKFGVYGFHTGGMIGIAIAHAFPERVTAVACNGVAVPSAEELKEILVHYLPPIEPRWDGSHLAWLWARIREQTIFFPWHNRTQAGRMNFPMPSPEHQHKSVLELLRAADHYHVAYRAAFVFHAESVVPELQAPSLLTAAARDPLAAHLDRLGDAHPASVQLSISPTADEALENCRAQLSAHPGDLCPPNPPSLAMPGKLWSQIVNLPGGPLRIRRSTEVEGRGLLILHDVGGSSATVSDLATAWAGLRPVLCPDLLGHGESGHVLPANGSLIEANAGALLAMLDTLEISSISVLGLGGGALVGLRMAAMSPGQIDGLAAVNLPAWNQRQREAWLQEGLPAMSPDWHGGHLSRCWHMVRDSYLYCPWFQRDQAAIRWEEPDLDERRLQTEVTAFLKAEGAWQAWQAEIMRSSVDSALSAAKTRVPKLVCAAAGPWRGMTQAAAADAGVEFHGLSADMSDSAAKLHELLFA